MAAGHQEIAQMIKREMDLLEATARNYVKLVRELLDKGAYVNVRDPEGRTPLTEAVWNNNPELVELLLERGANANTQKNDGATPLSIAQGRAYGKPRQEIVEMLKKAGAHRKNLRRITDCGLWIANCSF
jgi:ankyrin repeat protein